MELEGSEGTYRVARFEEKPVSSKAKEYLKQGRLDVKILGRGAVWLDTGTFPSLMQANQYVQVIEERQGRKIGCIEEAAYRMGYINKKAFETLVKPLMKSGYGKELLSII